MRSAEIAKHAGITVRTLRHYHAIGLLAEPARSANGYRDYSAEDLLRVLRIRQLASLGFTLDKIGEMLDDLDAERADESGEGVVEPVDSDERASEKRRRGTVDLLDELDEALQAQIAHLQGQRELIARLREHGLAADYPERASGALDAMERLADLANEPGFLGLALSDADYLAMGIAAHLYTQEELAEIERVFTAIVERDLVDEYREVSVLINGMPACANEDERVHAVEECLAFLEKLEDCFDATNWLRPDKDYEVMLDNATSGSFNAAQLDVSDRVFAAFARRMECRVRGVASV